MIRTGYSGINLKGKCHECKYYKPYTKENKNKILVIFSRGSCRLKDKYKQRTETCKRFEEINNAKGE